MSSYQQPTSLVTKPPSYGRSVAFYSNQFGGLPPGAPCLEAQLVSEPQDTEFNVALRVSGLGDKIMSGNGAKIPREEIYVLDFDLQQFSLTKFYVASNNPPVQDLSPVLNLRSRRRKITDFLLGSDQFFISDTFNPGAPNYFILGVKSISFQEVSSFNLARASVTLIL